MDEDVCMIDGSCCGPDSDCCIQGATYRSGRDTDFTEITSLLKANNLTTAGLQENCNGFIVAEKNGHIVGTAAIERYGRFGLLRSVAIADALKGQGLGSSLVAGILEDAKASGVEQVFLLTETAPKYFPRFGFSEIRRGEVPAEVQESVEFRGACCQSAIVMRKTL